MVLRFQCNVSVRSDYLGEDDVKSNPKEHLLARG